MPFGAAACPLTRTVLSLHSSSSLNTMPSAKVADGSYSTRPTLKNGMKRKRLALTTFVCDGWRHRLAASSFRFLRSFVAEKSGEDRQRDIELYKVLRSKKAELEELLKARISELRTICLREGEITGEMPEEMSATLRPGEEMPKLKKRVGTSFSIPEEILRSDKVRAVGHVLRFLLRL
ncbi:unnamed protein product [Heligmosomoides polygyrus]|uniref:DUF3338 domain-containing protein n=1 Tax=Heligmosomoides polygyrus TaxID=6339 RepID=A0A183FSQ7_HELPZ|nr:unnamed protein product [Heligmosomoides polygyrus]